MRIGRLFAFLAVTALAVPASAESFAGEWRATATVPDGEISETLTITKTADGYALTVKDVEPSPPEGMTAGPGVDVKLDGDNFSYKRIVETVTGPLEIFYAGVVSGDSFTGTGEIQGFSVPYTGVRLSKPE